MTNDRAAERSGLRPLVVVLLALPLLPTACESSRQQSPAPSRTAAEVVTLDAPSPRDPRDLDLHLHWRDARVSQVLPPLDATSAFRQHPEVVALDGAAHRALLLLPSLNGEPSVAQFRVRLPETGTCELVAWTAIDPTAQDPTDGVEYGIGVGESDPNALAIRFERLAAGKSSAWHEVHVDLAPYRGRSVWIVLAARESGDRRGDRLLWGDPRIRLAVSPAVPVVIDLGARDDATRRPRALPWSEVNVFKAYYLFKDEDAASTFPKSIPVALPWAHSLRLFSSLGGNSGPTLARDYEAQMGKNPSADSRRERRWAEEYEFFRDGPEWRSTPIAARFDWSAYDRMLDRAAATGLRLHVHMGGAPELFTGERGWYPSYHYNELPVVDETGWKEYVQHVFAHLASKPWFASAHFSVFSEPNCMWIEYDGSVRHFGYHGDAEQFARQYLWTWQAMKPYLRAGQLHLGPWVVEPDRANPVVDNLPLFLERLRTEFERAHEPFPPWSGFAFNVYETPQLALDGIAEYKIAYVRRLLAREFPDFDLPVRFDEIGVHPLVSMEFERDTGVALLSTRWALAWHAEMLALLVDERIQQAGPWYVAPDSPAYLAYLAATHVLGALDLSIAPGGTLTVGDGEGERRDDVSVRLASRSAERVGAIWSTDRDGDAIRLVLWHFPRFAETDDRLARSPRSQPVTVLLPSAPHGWRVTLMGPRGVRFPAEAAARHDRVTLASGGAQIDHAELTAADQLTLEIDPASMVMLDAERLP
jgi:hypothetical protein